MAITWTSGTGTPSSVALVSFEAPGSAPTTTAVVFLDTLPGLFPPWALIASAAASRLNPSSVPVTTTDRPSRVWATSSAEFDRAYIDHEVEYHRAVLNALDDMLIPNATNAELRETLVGVRPAFEAHLEHAQSLQRSLGS